MLNTYVAVIKIMAYACQNKNNIFDPVVSVSKILHIQNSVYILQNFLAFYLSSIFDSTRVVVVATFFFTMKPINFDFVAKIKKKLEERHIVKLLCN